MFLKKMDHYEDNPADELKVGDFLFCHLNSEGQLISASPNTLRIWDIESGGLMKTLTFGSEMHPGLFAILGQYLVCSPISALNTLKIFNMDSGQYSRALMGNAQIQEVAFFPGGRLVTRDVAAQVKIWDWVSGKCTHSIHEEYYAEQILPLSRDRFASVAEGGIVIRDFGDTGDTGSCLLKLTGHTDHVHDLVVLQGGQLASASYDGSIRVWDSYSGDCLQVMTDETCPPTRLAGFKGGLLASGHQGGFIKLWDTASGVCQKTFKSPVHHIEGLAAEDHLILSHHKGAISLWDLNLVPTPALASTVFFDPDAALEAPVPDSAPQIDEVD